MWYTITIIITLKLNESNALEETRQKSQAMVEELNFY